MYFRASACGCRSTCTGRGAAESSVPHAQLAPIAEIGDSILSSLLPHLPLPTAPPWPALPASSCQALPAASPRVAIVCCRLPQWHPWGRQHDDLQGPRADDAGPVRQWRHLDLWLPRDTKLAFQHHARHCRRHAAGADLRLQRHGSHYGRDVRHRQQAGDDVWSSSRSTAKSLSRAASPGAPQSNAAHEPGLFGHVHSNGRPASNGALGESMGHSFFGGPAGD